MVVKKGARKTKDKIKLAVFDIDGTIFRSSLLIQLINGLVEAGVFPETASKEMEKDYLAWLDRKGTYDNYLKQVIAIHLKYLDGARVEDVKKIVREVIAWQKDRVYRYTRDLIKKCKKEGYFLIAISGSPDYIVSAFAKDTGFDASFGCVYETERGVFTGRALNRDTVTDKKRVLTRLVKNLPVPIDMAQSIAVGDSEGDIPMLKMVGKPIAFNPNRILAQYAKKKKWKIVVERKDVIYDIKSHKFINHKS